MFNENSTKGMKTYYLNVSNCETINFAVPHTMMNWWIKNGYDPELAKKDRVAATKKMTEHLKSQWDAVWFRGQGLRKFLDGDQICVYDPSRVYEIDPTLSKPGDIGSKVRRKSDGMKGVIRRVRNLEPEQSRLYHGGTKRLLEVKWQKGLDYNVKDSDVDFLESRVPYKTASGGLVAKLTAFRPQLAAIAQRIYDEWDASDEDYGDAEVGFGGICHLIADGWQDLLINQGYAATTWTHSDVQHVSLMVWEYENEDENGQSEVVDVDLNPYTYETGGGFEWKKIPNVTIDPSDITFYRQFMSPENLEALQEGY
jgi:hypothetical protein